MDNNDQKDFEIEIENELVEDIKLSVQEQIYEIELKMQELDSQIEQYEEIMYQSEDDNIDYEKLENLKEEYNQLRKEKKLLLKQNKTKWDKIPIWMFAYGIFQVIFSSFYILFMVSLLFAGWFVTLFKDPNNITKFWQIFSLFFITFISILISVIILILIKDKVRKKFFAVVFSIQTVETIVSVIIMLNYMKDFVWNK